MNRPKKVDYRKTLVRNAEIPVSKSKVVIEGPKNPTKPELSESISLQKKSSKPVERKCEGTEVDLNLPELYSTLSISKKIDNVVNSRKTKSCSDVNKKVVIDDKVAKKVNIPHDQQVYKDLIPLTSEKPRSLHIPKKRTPAPKKDVEPVLSDFLTPREPPPQYFYAPEVNLEIKPVIVFQDNLRLYRTLQKYN